MPEDNLDARLTALLRQADPAPDADFVARVARAARADQALRTRRRATWRRFAGEVLGSLAIVGVFGSMWLAAPAGAEPGTLGFGPAAAAALMLAVWFAAALQPAAAENLR